MFYMFIYAKKSDSIGVVILVGILKLCIMVGIMIIPQSICQYLSGVELPLPAIITKVASFVLLGAFAIYFERKLYNSIKTNNSFN